MWYHKKRYWLVLFIIIIFIGSRTSVANFLYEPEVLIAELAASTNFIPEFNSIEFVNRNVSFIKIGKRQDKALLIFVHGSPGTLTAAKGFLSSPRLLRQADIISIDRLGYGNSDYGRAESSLEQHADMIKSILDNFDYSKVILIGHSMAGPIISKFAMKYVDHADGAVLVAPSISPALEPSNTWRKILDLPPICCLTPPAFRVCNQEIIPLKDELLAMESDWDRINIPVTIIQGTEDNLVSAGNADYAKQKLTNSRHVVLRNIVGGNHFIFWNEQETIVDEILNLIDEL